MSAARRRRSPVQPSADQVQSSWVREGGRAQACVPAACEIDASIVMAHRVMRRASGPRVLGPRLCHYWRPPRGLVLRIWCASAGLVTTGAVEHAEVEKAGALCRRTWNRQIFPIAFLVAALAGWDQCLGNVFGRRWRSRATVQRERDEQCRKQFRHISSLRCRPVAAHTATTLVGSVNMIKRQSGARPRPQEYGKNISHRVNDCRDRTFPLHSRELASARQPARRP